LKQGKLSFHPRVSFKLFKTGSVEESVFMLLMVIFVGVVVALHPQLLLKPLFFYLNSLSEHLTLLLFPEGVLSFQKSM